MRKRFKNIAVILMAVLIILGTLPFQTYAAADALSLNVTYDAKCGEPTTFTLNAAGGTGQYLYYFNSISRVGEDGLTHVTDPSRQAQYQAENTFQFTFCASGTYRLIFYVMDKGASPIAITRQIIDIVLNDPEYPTIEAIADNVAAECMQECNTDFDRALWLHDWLLDHCTYDYSYTYCGSEGAFARGTGTCETYHRAYTMLLNRVGIANGRIEGNGHVWTAVKLDGEWCQIDTTWDDNGRTNHSYENYLYFGLNDEITTMVHSDHSPNKGYESNSLDNNYFIRTGKIHQWSDPLMEPILKYLRTEEDAFTVGVTDSMPAGYKKVIYNLVAYQLSSQKWETETQSVKIDAGYYNGVMQITASYSPIESEEEHIWDNGTITKEATCTAEGVKTYTCTNCNETKTEAIPAAGHKIVTDEAVPATCNERGLTEGSHCSVCNVLFTVQKVIMPTGHKAVTDAAVEATCTKSGLTAGSHCSVCNAVIVAQKVVPATGHSYDNGKITKDATCTENGVKTYTCTKCNAIKTEAISATGHKAVTDSAVEATCTKSGLTAGSHCSVCNAVITAQETIPAIGHSYDNGKITKDATCKATGTKTYTCTHCNETKTETIAKTAHTYKTTTTKATTSKNGNIVTKCTVCDHISKNTAIAYPKTITLSASSYIYDGKVKKPTVTVKDSKGKKIAASNYTVTYASGRKNVGSYTVTIKFKGNYSGTVTKTFTIKPKATTLSSVASTSTGFTAKWKKQATQTTGYQIQYSTSSNFSNAKTVTVSKNSTTSKKITKLTGKKKYYVRVRTYKTVGKTKIYSSWSKSKSVTTKK